MTPEEFVRRGQAAQRAVDTVLEDWRWQQAYDQMDDEALALMHRALTLDKGRGAYTAAFCDTRLAYIAQLQEARRRGRRE